MIKPCKECGNEPIIQHRYDNTYWVYCCRYYCNNAEVIHAETKEKAIELWNKEQEHETRQICRNCKLKDDCKIDRKKRESQYNGAWDEWTCGMWQSAQFDIKEIIKTIEAEYELKFRYDDFFNTYLAKANNDVVIDLDVSAYWTDDEKAGQSFISVGYQGKDRGGSRPCDSIEEVKKFLDGIPEVGKNVQMTFF